MGLKFAVMSDIHGNTWALKAVLRDIKSRGIIHIVNLGDNLYGPLDPAGTAEILISENILSISGNQDRSIIESRGKETVNPTMKYVLTNLTQDVLDWLEGLPKQLELFEKVFVCHGTSTKDNEYMTEKITENGAELYTVAELESRTNDIDKQMIICGHSHLPRIIQLPNGKLIINPGSVGLPAYDDELPFFHVMESETPHARYCIIEDTEDGWVIEQVAVPYEWKTPALEAASNNRRDWEKWILTGRV